MIQVIEHVEYIDEQTEELSVEQNRIRECRNMEDVNHAISDFTLTDPAKIEIIFPK